MSLPPNIDPSEIPALEPPPGVLPNFVDPYTRGPMLLALSAVAVGIMYLFVTVRFYCKFFVRKTLSWDDLTCTLATLGITGYFIGVVFLEKAGLGTHQWNLRAIDLIQDSFLKPLYILVNLQPLVALFMKLSFLIYFLHIFGPKPFLRWNILIGIFVTVAFYVAVTITLFVLSTPGPGVTFAKKFMSFLSRKTSPVLTTSFVIGYFNIFSDLYILILPISGVMGLKLPPRRKFGVSLIFMTGLLALGSSSASLYYRYLINHSGDTTWNLMPAAYLSILELSIGIDCSSMPACAVVARRHLPLFTAFGLQVNSLLRTLGARLSPNGRLSYFRFFGRSGAGTSSDYRTSGSDSKGEEAIILEGLPEVSKGVHQMKTARAFFLGSKNQTVTTMDEDEATLVNRQS